MERRTYISSLSKRQWVWAAVGLVLVILLVVLGLTLGTAVPDREGGRITLDMTLKEAAPVFGVTGSALAKELGLPLDAPKNVPMDQLGITGERLRDAENHLLGHAESTLKYYLYGAVVLWGWIFLVKIGRPDKAGSKRRKIWFPRLGYLVPVFLAVVVLGFVLGKSPNPMEGAVKLFKTMVGLYPDALAKTAAFFFFIGLAVVGNKLVCGWACPFGGLTELLYSIPWLKKLKRYKVPFWVSNSIRGGLFIAMLFVLFGVIGNNRGFVIHHLFNPFNLFNYEFEGLSILITVVVSLILGLVIYRPFCQFICPFGFLSWIAERISLYRVRVDHDTCTECGNCIRACPIEAAKGRVEKKKFPADCFSCARCLNTCPVDAITYEFIGTKKKAQQK
jgi:NAD-dependent dihydropyrimidine dehydrogenase PreA subunit